ncbi:glycine cleavage system protein GcvH [Clostridium sp. DL1XJH146]
MKIIENLLYTEEHEWLSVDGDTAYLGITDYAQHALGSIVYVELPEEGEELEKGESFGSTESVKAASDIYIPVDCTILEINEALEDEPELINTDCYENWIIRIKITDKSQLHSLLSAEDYKNLINKEA